MLVLPSAPTVTPFFLQSPEGRCEAMQKQSDQYHYANDQAVNVMNRDVEIMKTTDERLENDMKSALDRE